MIVNKLSRLCKRCDSKFKPLSKHAKICYKCCRPAGGNRRWK
jgi:hypothetical protein